MQFDRGLHFALLRPSTRTDGVGARGPYVLLTDRKVNLLKDLIPLLEQVAKSGRPLLRGRRRLRGRALATLIVNQIRGILRCVAVKAPGFGDRRKAMLADMARSPAASWCPKSSASSSRTCRLNQLGRAKRVVVDRTPRRSSAVRAIARRSRVAWRRIRREIEKSTSDYDKEKLEERLAKLAGGVAVIRVGAPVRVGR